MGDQTERRTTWRVLDLFCGAGGWAAGLDRLGIDPADTLGVDINSTACATHQLAGFPTLNADVTRLEWADFTGIEGLIASPPCQDYSTAGNGTAGTGDLTHIVPQAVAALRPDWIVCEQVPAVMPIWLHHADLYRQWGYDVWAGLLDASAYGTPQRRYRAVLIASGRSPVSPPAATHQDGGLFGQPTVTAAEALNLPHGWSINRRQQSNGQPVVNVPCNRPAPTVTGKAAGQWLLKGPNGQRRNMTVRQLAALQGFPGWWPWQGTKTQQGQQVGNAVPPPLAEAALRAVVPEHSIAKHAGAVTTYQQLAGDDR